MTQGSIESQRKMTPLLVSRERERQLDEVEAKSAKDNQTLLIALMQELGT